MPRPRKWPPPIHQSKGMDRCRIYGPDGKAHWKTLGPHGSEASKKVYRQVLADAEKDRVAAEGDSPIRADADISVAEVIATYYREWVTRRERLEKLRSSQAGRIWRSLRPVLKMFAELPAAEFGVRQLEEARTQLVTTRTCYNCRIMRAKARKEGREEPTCKRCTDNPGLVRRYVNQLVWCIIRCFRWAGKRGLIPASVYGSLSTLEGLREGDDGRSSKEVLPADDDAVEKILPLLPAPLAAVVRLQVLTGARPSELMRLTPGDLDQTGRIEVRPGQVIDTAGKVWSVQPKQHKNKWRGHRRLVLFGPAAQEVLRPFLTGRAAEAFLFSPREAVAALRARQRAERKTPVPPSQESRRVACPKKAPGERYTPCSFNQAVKRACERAGVARWYPYQLRHNAATRLVEEYGWDLARIVLGHKSLDMTRIYGADNIGKAAEAMGESG